MSKKTLHDDRRKKWKEIWKGRWRTDEEDDGWTQKISANGENSWRWSGLEDKLWGLPNGKSWLYVHSLSEVGRFEAYRFMKDFIV